MTTIYTADLTGAALDWAVAKCEGLTLFNNAQLAGVSMEGWYASGYYTAYNQWVPLGSLRYSTDWAQGGPISERRRIEATSKHFLGEPARAWMANLPGSKLMDSQFGPTELIAKMRCLVASELGDTVDVPEELL